MESLGKNAAPERTEEVLKVLRFDVLQRLHACVSCVWPQVCEDIYKDVEGSAPPLLELDKMAPEMVFRFFCFETCCTHRDNLREWYASFNGSVAQNWFATRTTDKSSDAFSRALALWEKNGWIEPAEGAHDFFFYLLSASGIQLWNTCPEFFASQSGLVTLRTPEQFRAQLETRSSTLLEEVEDVYAVLLLGVPQAMTAVDLLQRIAAAHSEPRPLQTYIEQAGYLVGYQYVTPVNPQHKDVVFEVQKFTSTGGVAPEFVIADLRDPFVLNVRRRFLGPTPAGALEVVTSLWETFRNKGLAHAKHTALSWIKFSVAVLALQGVSAPCPPPDAGGEWSEQARTEATCFWVNLFNLLYMHAYSSARSRLPFLAEPEHHAAYNVGGTKFSLRVIREGILGGNLSVFDGESDPRLACRLSLKGDLALPLVYLCSRGSVSEVVLTPQNVVTDWQPRVKAIVKDNVECSTDGLTWNLPTALELFVTLHGGPGLAIAQLLLPCLPLSVQEVVAPAVYTKKKIKVQCTLEDAATELQWSRGALPVEGESSVMATTQSGAAPSMAPAGAAAPAAAVAAGATGVPGPLAVGAAGGATSASTGVPGAPGVPGTPGGGSAVVSPTSTTPAAATAVSNNLGTIAQSLVNTQARLALMKTGTVTKQREFENILQVQQQLKSCVFLDDDAKKKLDAELKDLEREHARYHEENTTKKALLADMRSSLQRSKAVAMVAHEILTSLWKDYPVKEGDDDYKTYLENMYLHCMDSLSRLVSKSEASQDLQFRDPLELPQQEGYFRSETEKQHVTWLKEKGRSLLPKLPDDDAFLESLIAAHTELADDSGSFDRWTSNGLVASYGRFCASWRERVALLQENMNVPEQSAGVLAQGWVTTDLIYAGMLRYASEPAAVAAVDECVRALGVDPKLKEIGDLYPLLAGMVTPGRFFLLHDTITCSRGTDAPMDAVLILCNDILVAYFIGVNTFLHHTELCVLIQDATALTVEVLDSSIHIPLKLDLKTKERFQKWNKGLFFSTLVAKQKKARGVSKIASKQKN